MILHLMINSKISEEFIKYLNKNFDISEHNIIVWNGGNSPNINLENLNGVTIIKTKKDLLIFYLKHNTTSLRRIILQSYYIIIRINMQLKIMLLFNLSENGNFTIKNFKFLYKNRKKLFVKK